MKRIIFILLAISFTFGLNAQKSNWYKTEKFDPSVRLVFKIKNVLNIERKNVPVVIKRADFPLPDVHEMWITVVDHELPSYEGPSQEILKLYGGHQLLVETMGGGAICLFEHPEFPDSISLWIIKSVNY